MKKLIFIGLGAALLFASCKKKDVSNSSDSNKVESKEELNVVSENVTLIQFSKSSCYGKCPTYSFTLTPEGLMAYNGVANVPLIGEHKIKANANFASSILERALAINYFELKEKYDNQYVTDIPSTTLSIETDKRSGKTYARHEIPTDLLELNDYIHEEVMNLTQAIARIKKEPRIITVDPGDLKQRPEKKVR